MSTLAKRIKSAQKAKKKTQDEVAEAIGVSKNTVSDWERGLKQPGFLNITNYYNFLGITLDELLEFKKQRYFHIIINEEEREKILLVLDECERESENSPLHEKLRFLKQYINALLERT